MDLPFHEERWTGLRAREQPHHRSGLSQSGSAS
jgi:hypothetical protein